MWTAIVEVFLSVYEAIRIAETGKKIAMGLKAGKKAGKLAIKKKMIKQIPLLGNAYIRRLLEKDYELIKKLLRNSLVPKEIKHIFNFITTLKSEELEMIQKLSKISNSKILKKVVDIEVRKQNREWKEAFKQAISKAKKERREWWKKSVLESRKKEKELAKKVRQSIRRREKEFDKSFKQGLSQFKKQTREKKKRDALLTKMWVQEEIKAGDYGIEIFRNKYQRQRIKDEADNFHKQWKTFNNFIDTLPRNQKERFWEIATNKDEGIKEKNLSEKSFRVERISGKNSSAIFDMVWIPYTFIFAHEENYWIRSSKKTTKSDLGFLQVIFKVNRKTSYGKKLTFKSKVYTFVNVKKTTFLKIKKEPSLGFAYNKYLHRKKRHLSSLSAFYKKKWDLSDEELKKLKEKREQERLKRLKKRKNKSANRNLKRTKKRK